MIFVRDKGRMCNNILQYGHVYAWAREHGRSVMSMRFSYKYQYFKLCHQTKHNFLFYVLGKYAAKFHLLPVVTYETAECEGNSVLEQKIAENGNVMVEGWFVRFYELFIKYKKDIIDLFEFDDEIEKRVSDSMASTSGNIRLGLHIRRGDYKTHMGGRYYYDDDVYLSFVSQFVSLNKGKNIIVYICGNDPALNREYYVKNLPECSVIFPDGNPAEDLCMLSKCDYIIGAPSTFSLVAAMYRDLPLYWIEQPDEKLLPESFKYFDFLFRHII